MTRGGGGGGGKRERERENDFVRTAVPIGSANRPLKPLFFLF
jgi:hypothetical protein